LHARSRRTSLGVSACQSAAIAVETCNKARNRGDAANARLLRLRAMSCGASTLQQQCAMQHALQLSEGPPGKGSGPRSGRDRKIRPWCDSGFAEPPSLSRRPAYSAQGLAVTCLSVVRRASRFIHVSVSVPALPLPPHPPAGDGADRPCLLGRALRGLRRSFDACSDATPMERLLDFSVPLDVALLDRVVEIFYDPLNPEVPCRWHSQRPPRSCRAGDAPCLCASDAAACLSALVRTMC
jgi:hypothetical protein